MSETVAMCSVGTLGGGNHFIEIDKDEDGNLYLVVHTGSRRVGKDIAEYYQTEHTRLLVILEMFIKSLRKRLEKIYRGYKESGKTERT